MKIEVYVLTGRCGFNSLGTSVSTDLDKLRKEMTEACWSALKDLDGKYEESGTGCGEDAATIVTSGDWHEWVITTHTVELDCPLRFTLPNGVVIGAELNGDGADEHRGEWKSIDITATHPNGVVDTLCAVDWEAGRGTKAIVFETGAEDPVFTQLYREIDEADGEKASPDLPENLEKGLI